MTPRVRRAGPDAAAVFSSLNTDVQALHAAALPFRFKMPTAEVFPPAEAGALLKNPNTLTRGYFARFHTSVAASRPRRGSFGLGESGRRQENAAATSKRRRFVGFSLRRVHAIDIGATAPGFRPTPVFCAASCAFDP